MKRVAVKTLFAFAVFCGASGFAGPQKSKYVDLKEKSIWSFNTDQHKIIVLITGADTIQGKSYSRVEWHYDKINQFPFYAEYWFSRGDSIFCAGVKAFGSNVMYAKPSIVIANKMKPGDSWSFVTGSGIFQDTAQFKVEAIDTLQLPSGGSGEALRIVKRTKGGVALSRWFAKGEGLVRETREGGDGIPAPTLQMK